MYNDPDFKLIYRFKPKKTCSKEENDYGRLCWFPAHMDKIMHG